MAFSKSLLGVTRGLFGINNLRASVKFPTSLRCLSTESTTPDVSNTTGQSVAEFEARTSNDFNDEAAAELASTEMVNETSQSIENHPFKIAKAIPIRNSPNHGWQPTVETHSLLQVEGVPYNKLDTVYVRSTKNNTILNLVDLNGTTLYSVSAGAVGFKNCKKSTAIAGQAVGLAMSDHIKRRGIKNVKVMLKGFGNGRLPAVKALQMSSIQIISITDRTPIPMAFARPPRPPVPRKV